ncbi:GDCCVxC domain-containing (seleno)protein [Povalibacter uvarum]|uniref:GDCCVxC domain-containing (seleno)protein n=1 Tax=Povalibacter uvarum TaxID=732238 RepID=UPI0024839547|nr:GDCCVxC domain-containing (seleno)protein [Povalibacter uvarum]
MILESHITCPACGHVSIETMPTDACIYFFECTRCKTLLRPQAGHCCVFCSYGSVPCPPMQSAESCCAHPTASTDVGR